MKATGIVRKVDELGRIVIPIELRRNLNIENGDPVEIFVDSDTIVLRKHEPACIFCGSMDNVEVVGGKNICEKCINEIKSL